MKYLFPLFLFVIIKFCTFVSIKIESNEKEIFIMCNDTFIVTYKQQCFCSVKYWKRFKGCCWF